MCRRNSGSSLECTYFDLQSTFGVLSAMLALFFSTESIQQSLLMCHHFMPNVKSYANAPQITQWDSLLNPLRGMRKELNPGLRFQFVVVIAEVRGKHCWQAEQEGMSGWLWAANGERTCPEEDGRPGSRAFVVKQIPTIPRLGSRDFLQFSSRPYE